MPDAILVVEHGARRPVVRDDIVCLSWRRVPCGTAAASRRCFPRSPDAANTAGAADGLIWHTSPASLASFCRLPCTGPAEAVTTGSCTSLFPS